MIAYSPAPWLTNLPKFLQVRQTIHCWVAR